MTTFTIVFAEMNIHLLNEWLSTALSISSLVFVGIKFYEWIEKGIKKNGASK